MKKLKLFQMHWKTSIHKLQVMRFILKACWALIKRGFIHDFSKYSKHEAPHFAAAEELTDFEYGSQEYKDMLKRSLDSALNHHYSNNSHHPQYYPDGIKDMDLLDIIEMLCDWKAATLRHKTGDIKKSVEINMDRFQYDERLKNKFERFYKETKSW